LKKGGVKSVERLVQKGRCCHRSQGGKLRLLSRTKTRTKTWGTKSNAKLLFTRAGSFLRKTCWKKTAHNAHLRGEGVGGKAKRNASGLWALWGYLRLKDSGAPSVRRGKPPRVKQKRQTRKKNPLRRRTYARGKAGSPVAKP